MNDRHLLKSCIFSLFFLAVPAAAVAEEGANVTDHCAGYDAAAQHAFQLMETEPTRISAGKSGSVFPGINVDQNYRLDLPPQMEVAFPTPPARHTLAEGAFAGMVQFTTGREGRYRINISDGSWVDLVSGSGKLLESTAFSGRHLCQPLRKYVEYVLPADTLHTIQFSGGAKAALTLVVSAIE